MNGRLTYPVFGADGTLSDAGLAMMAVKVATDPSAPVLRLSEVITGGAVTRA